LVGALAANLAEPRAESWAALLAEQMAVPLVPRMAAKWVWQKADDLAAWKAESMAVLWVAYSAVQ
jgi:hypothetical protein